MSVVALAATPSTLVITTNAPVLRWTTRVDPTLPHHGPTAIVALRVNVSGQGAFWSTGDVRQNVLSSWQGLAVYEGPDLVANASFEWTAEERVVAYSNGSAGSSTFELAGSGRFLTSPDLPSARGRGPASAARPAPRVLPRGTRRGRTRPRAPRRARACQAARRWEASNARPPARPTPPAATSRASGFVLFSFIAFAWRGSRARLLFSTSVYVKRPFKRPLRALHEFLL